LASSKLPFRSLLDVVRAGEPLPDPMAAVSMDVDGRQALLLFRRIARLPEEDVTEPTIVRSPVGPGSAVDDLRLPPSQTHRFTAHISTVYDSAEHGHGLYSTFYKMYGTPHPRGLVEAAFPDRESDRVTHVFANPGIIRKYRETSPNFRDSPGATHVIVGEGAEATIPSAIEASTDILNAAPHVIPFAAVERTVAFLLDVATSPRQRS
jgi:hypothetical protein